MTRMNQPHMKLGTYPTEQHKDSLDGAFAACKFASTASPIALNDSPLVARSLYFLGFGCQSWPWA